MKNYKKEKRGSKTILLWKNPEYKEHMREAHKGKKQSVETIKKRMLNMYGKNHPNWKGDNVGYFGLHDWVYSQLGTPLCCNFCGKHEGKFTWANKSHEYKRDLTDWLPLCYSCHKKYDLEYRRSKIEKEIKC